MLITTAARMEDPGADSRVIWEIAQAPAVVSIRLAALSEDAVGELVRDRFGLGGESAFCAACHRATGGNPLLVLGELLKSMRAVAVARAIAVLGDGASLPATASLSNLDERSVADATRALVAAEILRPSRRSASCTPKRTSSR